MFHRARPAGKRARAFRSILERIRHPVRAAGNARCRDGRRQECLPGRDDQPAGPARGPGPRRLRHHRPGLPRVPGAGRPRRAHPRRAGEPERRRRHPARRERRAHPPVDHGDALPAGPRGGGTRDSCAACQPAPTSPSRCAPRPPPRICPTPPSPASRRPSSTCAATTGVLQAMHEVFASLFNDRAISYRVHQGFDHSAVALSAGVQHMVRSDLGASGVMFTLDTESGFRDVVFITASYGLGETVVQGAVNPDEFYVYKPALRAGKHAHPAPQPRRARPSRWCTRGGLGGARCRPSTCRAADRQPLLPRATPTCVELATPGADHRGALRAAHGHRVGQGRQRRQHLHPAGASGDGEEPRRPHHPALQAQGHARTVLAEGPQHRPEDRRRPGARDPRRRARWSASRPATCWWPT